ncbi:MAG: hypothetical protein ABEJ28_11270 [Salinigranum sp.]
MAATRSLRTRPAPLAVSGLALASAAFTVAYWAGFFPGIPQAASMYVRLFAFTLVLSVFSAAAWVVTGDTAAD